MSYRHFLVLFSICLPSFLLAQHDISFSILDKEKEMPIEYANISLIQSNRGINADENGKATLSLTDAELDNEIAISAIGFETEFIQLSNTDTGVIRILLSPTAYNINEIVVTPPLQNKKVVLNFRKAKSFDYSYGTRGYIQQIAMLFQPPSDSVKWFIDKIDVLPINFWEKGKNNFGIRIYDVKRNGKPGKLLTQTALIGQSSNKKKYVQFDVLEEQIQLPPEGVYIAFEWFKTEENYFEKDIEHKDDSVRTVKGYMPSIAQFPKDAQPATIYILNHNGKWEKNSFTTRLGMVLHLTD